MNETLKAFELALVDVTRADCGPFAGDGHAQHGDFRAAHALWRAVTKESRHEQRTAATIAAARVNALSYGLQPTCAATALALILDRIGVGGTAGLGGDSGGTTRLGVFGRLGKGRKKATDGGCWMHALDRAIHQVAPFGGFVCDGPGETGLVLAVYPHNETYESSAGWGEHDADWRPDFFDHADDEWWVQIPACMDASALVGRVALAAVGILWEGDDHVAPGFVVHVSTETPRRAGALFDACMAAVKAVVSSDSDW